MKPIVVDNFLSKDECNMLIHMIRSNHKRSNVVGDEKIVETRTSSTHHFTNTRYIYGLNERIKRKLRVTTDGENMQGQFYKKGEYYNSHYDFFEDLMSHNPERGNRTWTFMIYLNKPEKGGYTYFNKYDLYIKPEVGRAVYWNSLHSDGSGNEMTMHKGMPVLEGEKFIVTKWFRQFS